MKTGFFDRWSSRKAEDRRRKAPEPPVEPSPEEGPSPEAVEAYAAQLPPVEEIGPETDIRPFLKNLAPKDLRKAALRRLWTTDPTISTHLDVARDYAWDFNAGEGPAGFRRVLAQEAVSRGLDLLKSDRIARKSAAGPQRPESPAEAPDAPALPEPKDQETPPAPEPLPPLESAKRLISAPKTRGAALPD